MAMQESLESGRSDSWVGQMNAALVLLGCSCSISGMQTVDVKKCLQEADKKWTEGRQLEDSTQVRDIPDSDHVDFKLKTYLKWFEPGADVTGKQRFTYHLFDKDQVHAMARFRMGVHWMNSECMRKGADGRPVLRSARLCPCCTSGAREDEMHVFECPFYQDIRVRYQQLFPTGQEDVALWDDSHMKSAVNGNGTRSFWNKLANFLLACQRKRKNFLAGQPVST
jgi:hypothetical protein